MKTTVTVQVSMEIEVHSSWDASTPIGHIQKEACNLASLVVGRVVRGEPLKGERERLHNHRTRALGVSVEGDA